MCAHFQVIRSKIKVKVTLEKTAFMDFRLTLNYFRKIVLRAKVAPGGRPPNNTLQPHFKKYRIEVAEAKMLGLYVGLIRSYHNDLIGLIRVAAL